MKQVKFSYTGKRIILFVKLITAIKVANGYGPQHFTEQRLSE